MSPESLAALLEAVVPVCRRLGVTALKSGDVEIVIGAPAALDPVPASDSGVHRDNPHVKPSDRMVAFGMEIQRRDES